MKLRSFKSSLFLVIPGLILVFIMGTYIPGSKVTLENSSFRYEIGHDGRNLHFTEKVTGSDLLDTGHISYCAYIISENRQYNVTSVSLKRKLLHLEFGNTGFTAELSVTWEEDRIILKVINVTGEAESLIFLNVPLKLAGMPYEPFATCALSMNLFTHVRQIPALQTQMWAACYKRFGMKGAEVIMIGVSQEKILPVIRDVMTHAKDIPFSDKGGAWAMMQKEGSGSYLMNFGTLTETTVGEWIRMCKSLGFNQIDNHGGGGFFKFGDFELNHDKWPDGWESFKRINMQLHESGISSIFHTYAFFIDKNSRYVTPVPSEDLGYFNSFTLSGPLSETDTEISVNESTGNISTITGFFVRNSKSLRIGSEIIEFSGVTRTPPYKFTGCRRGVNGTRVSLFNTGEKVYHLREMFGKFLPGPETRLFDEIAKNTAKIVNDCGFDGIYLDAIDGSDILAGDENFWYYSTKFIFEVARNLEHPVGMEMSSMAHHWWHYRSRWQAWDRPVRGYKRFIDIHLAAVKSTRLFLLEKIKSNENEHGLWRGNTPLINKYAPAQNGSLLLPLHLGWWGNQVWNPPQVEPTFPDDIEYLGCKMIGNNAGISMLGGADEKTLEKYPLFRKLTGIIKQYEELRQSNYFSESIRSQLREPGKEYALFREDDGKWNFRPVVYDKHKIAGLKHESSRWTVTNKFESQPFKVRIEPLMSVKRYNDSTNVVLADLSRPGEFILGGCAESVTGGLVVSDEKTEDGSQTGLFFARSSINLPKEGLWIKMEKKFDPWLDINKNEALGVWIKGDGNGELLNFRIESPNHISHGARGDHFVKIDFKGWKYFELVEVESSEFSNYLWPDSGLYVYNSYRHTVQFKSVDKIQIWFNNLTPEKDVKCLIGSIKALPMVAAAIQDPCIETETWKIVFPVRMEPGMYLELRAQSDCKLYSSNGELLQDVKIEGDIPVLKAGDNKIIFSSRGNGEVNQRVQVTVISEGKPLEQ
jgi:hypothetical protein